MYTISEIGTTSNADIKTAKQLIDISKEAGADAVKFQIIRPEQLSKIVMGNHKYQTSSGMKEENTINMLKRLAFEDYELVVLSKYARENQLDFFVTEDFIEDIDFSNSMSTRFHKICRGTWRVYDQKLDLLSKMLGDRKETIIDVYDLADAADVPRHDKIWVQYFPQLPVTEDTIGKTIYQLKHTFKRVGYSTPNNNLDQEKIAKKAGATFMEKILTLDKTTESPDHFFGAEPDEFKEFVKEMKQ